jgi:glycosyltransferase involved in cell wall biosynthesis
VRVWLVKIGEGGRGGRPYRIDMLAESLRSRGHDVLLWTSNFDHIEKRHLFDCGVSRNIAERFDAIYMHSPGYKRNVSLQRLWDHRCIAHRFRELMRKEAQKPDVVLCCLPTLGLCKAAVEYGKASSIPVVIDVRDLWPDVFLTVAPQWGRAFAQSVMQPLSDSTDAILAGAAGITAVSEEYLQWGIRRAGRASGTNDAVFPLSFTPPNTEGVDGRIIRRQLSDMGVDLSKRLCVFAGTLGSTYDIETVLACSAVLAREPRYADVRVVFCGDGDKRRLLTDRNRPMNAVYTGWLSQPQLHYLMSRTRLGFLSYTRSALQSLPNKVYEYMASGVAIVSSLEREAKCLIETRECGLSYRAEDLQSMTNSVMTLLDDDARCRRYGENGRRTFEREFRAEVVYSRMSGHLEKVAGFSANSAAHPDKTGDRECALGVLRS